MKALDGSLCALGSVIFISACWIIEADETELTGLDLLVLSEDQGFDVSVGAEQSSDFGVAHLDGDVLDVDVVDEGSQGSSVLGLKSHGLGIGIVGGTGNGSSSWAFLLEANEAVASGAVVWVKRNLETLDGTVLFEFGLELFVGPVLGDALDKDVVVGKLLLVTTEELFVELEGSAHLAVDGEVLHLFAGILEFLGVLDLHNA